MIPEIMVDAIPMHTSELSGDVVLAIPQPDLLYGLSIQATWLGPSTRHSVVAGFQK